MSFDNLQLQEQLLIQIEAGNQSEFEGRLRQFRAIEKDYFSRGRQQAKERAVKRHRQQSQASQLYNSNVSQDLRDHFKYFEQGNYAKQMSRVQLTKPDYPVNKRSISSCAIFEDNYKVTPYFDSHTNSFVTSPNQFPIDLNDNGCQIDPGMFMNQNHIEQTHVKNLAVSSKIHVEADQKKSQPQLEQLVQGQRGLGRLTNYQGDMSQSKKSSTLKIYSQNLSKAADLKRQKAKKVQNEINNLKPQNFMKRNQKSLNIAGTKSDVTMDKYSRLIKLRDQTKLLQFDTDTKQNSDLQSTKRALKSNKINYEEANEFLKRSIDHVLQDPVDSHLTAQKEVRAKTELPNPLNQDYNIQSLGYLKLGAKLDLNQQLRMMSQLSLKAASHLYEKPPFIIRGTSSQAIEAKLAEDQKKNYSPLSLKQKKLKAQRARVNSATQRAGSGDCFFSTDSKNHEKQQQRLHSRDKYAFRKSIDSLTASTKGTNVAQKRSQTAHRIARTGLVQQAELKESRNSGKTLNFQVLSTEAQEQAINLRLDQDSQVRIIKKFESFGGQDIPEANSNDGQEDPGKDLAFIIGESSVFQMNQNAQRGRSNDPVSRTNLPLISKKANVSNDQKSANKPRSAKVGSRAAQKWAKLAYPSRKSVNDSQFLKSDIDARAGDTLKQKMKNFKRRTQSNIQLSPNRNSSYMMNSSWSNIVNLAVGGSKFLDNEYVDASVIDARGNVAYKPKHRKPKWVMQAELDRFNKFEDSHFVIHNSNQGRILIEDPFMRRKGYNKIFDHITDAEISKYISQICYLERIPLPESKIKGVDGLLNHSQITNNMLFQQRQEMRQEQEKLTTVDRQKHKQEFQHYGFKNLETDVKANADWITNYGANPTHIRFLESIRSRNSRILKDFCFQEYFKEDSIEWKHCFDPYSFEQRYRIYGIELPKYFANRQAEILKWKQVMQRRAKFEDLENDLGEDVMEQVKALHKQNEPILMKKQQAKDDWKKEAYLQMLDDMDNHRDLRPPKLRFPKLYWPEYNEHQSRYEDFFDISKSEHEEGEEEQEEQVDFMGRDPQRIARDELQTKITKQLEIIKEELMSHALAYTASFQRSYDQSDYNERIYFQSRLLESKNYDCKSVKNDDQYRQVQKRWMQGMISKHDKSLLTESGIDESFSIRKCHNQLDRIIFKYNFSEKQYDDYYYQWFADYLRQSSLESRHEFRDFYRTKKKHETMWSRQKEGYFAKARLFSKYYDALSLTKSIHYPQWTNIWDKQNKLLPDQKQFEYFYTKFLKYFKDKGKTLEPVQHVCSVQDAQKLLFVLDVDHIENINIDPDYVGPIELRFPELIFRSKFVDPEQEWHDLPAMERFEMIYPSASTFSDKRLLHEAVSQICIKKRMTQLKQLRELKDYRMNLKQHLEEKYQRQIKETEHDFKQKLRRYNRAQSFDSLKLQASSPEIKQDVERGYKYWDLKHLLPLREENLILERNDKLELITHRPVYKHPVRAFEPQFITEYLDKAILLIQNQSPSNCTKLYDRQDQQQVEKQNGKLIKWLESSLGDFKHLDLFEITKERHEIEDPQRNHASFRDRADVFDEREKIVPEYQNQVKKDWKMTIERDKGVLPLIPDFMPQHATLDAQLPQRPIYDINQLEVDLSEAHDEAIKETEEEVKSNISEMNRYTFDPNDEAVKQMTMPSNLFMVPQQLQDYAAKQLRKEVIRTIQEGDLAQLNNILESFGGLLNQKPESFANFQSPKTGESFLHYVILMNFDAKKPFIVQQRVNEAQNEDQQGEKSGFFGGMMQKREITTAVAEETDSSLEKKAQVVRDLVSLAKADPSIEDLFGNSARDLAGCLRRSDEVLQAMN